MQSSPLQARRVNNRYSSAQELNKITEGREFIGSGFSRQPDSNISDADIIYGGEWPKHLQVEAEKLSAESNVANVASNDNCGGTIDGGKWPKHLQVEAEKLSAELHV